LGDDRYKNGQGNDQNAPLSLAEKVLESRDNNQLADRNTEPMTFTPLPLAPWEPAKRTLHHFVQIIGKIRMARMPPRNHWWHLTLYVDPLGISTHGMPLDDGGHQFTLLLNLLDHRLELTTSRGERHSFSLTAELSVASFYRQTNGLLEGIGAPTPMLAKPFDLDTDRPFAELHDLAHYDPAAVSDYWRALLWVDGVLKEFAGYSYAKTCPVHIYWHHFDLVTTRFSGRFAPPQPPGTRAVELDAYSHEVISFGFWPGDDNVREAAFYSYTYPSPQGLAQQRLQPRAAEWVDSNGSPLAYLSWQALVDSASPRRDLLDFLQSAYLAGATLADWEVEKDTYVRFGG
jgi:hypothetical protein